jgi:hypothetical protein
MTDFRTVETHRNAVGCTGRRPVVRLACGFKCTERVPHAVQQGWQGAWPERVLCDVGYKDACDQVDARVSPWIRAGTPAPPCMVAGPEDGRALRRQGLAWAQRLHRSSAGLLQGTTADNDRQSGRRLPAHRAHETSRHCHDALRRVRIEFLPGGPGRDPAAWAVRDAQAPMAGALPVGDRPREGVAHVGPPVRSASARTS